MYLLLIADTLNVNVHHLNLTSGSLHVLLPVKHTCKEHSLLLQRVFVGRVDLAWQVGPVGGHQHWACWLAPEVNRPEQEPEGEGEDRD